MPALGAPGWKKVKTPRPLNAASEAVRGGLAGCGPLHANSKDAARRVKAIREGVKALGKHPGIGRPVEEMLPEFRH